MNAKAVKEVLKAHVGRAYAPYSGFPVVALVEAEGEVFLGVNVENASFPLSQCAEGNAVAAMVLAGKRRLERVHVYSPKGPIPPCGGCRQVLMEFGGPEVEVVLHGPEEEVRTTLGALLPLAFRL
ncbi:cytidine deaminase [Thermus thermophilus]|uniref:cytidine deaminase n=1 Tax=Thermus thermophilus TaxID=274 RepID=UPI001FCB34B8|nr:cytidine deaminase [Thermus thermophilus]BDG29066.1 cytidine deaminase [Thermus thermophilus]